MDELPATVTSFVRPQEESNRSSTPVRAVQSSALPLPPAGPEIVVGLISALGSNTALICDVFAEAFAQVGYRTEVIHIIEKIREFEQWSKISDTPRDSRYNALMDAGNTFRQQLGSNDALALLSIEHIRRIRATLTGAVDAPSSRTAYLIRSLKNADEVETLRRVYGRNFIAIGTNTSEKIRIHKLGGEIAESKNIAHTSECDADAMRLLKRDEAESTNKFGQNIRAAYPLADFFISANEAVLESDANRVVELFFGNFRHTPKQHEYGMYHAFGAALRSASLARQVGAAICDYQGDVIALGCNDVPQNGGGISWGDRGSDNRDHIIGYDTNDKMKRMLVRDVLQRLQSNKWLSEKFGDIRIEEIVQQALDVSDAPLRGSQVMDIIEYGRAVHAEMGAITSAARRGVSLYGTTLYTTTFPCHNCAKHILATGISRVVYIEPYPKSFTQELYGQNITVDSTTSSLSGVPFESFLGVAPRQYDRLYKMGDTIRKENGQVVPWKASTALPRESELARTYMFHETESINRLNAKMSSAGIRFAK